MLTKLDDSGLLSTVLYCGSFSW